MLLGIMPIKFPAVFTTGKALCVVIKALRTDSTSVIVGRVTIYFDITLWIGSILDDFGTISLRTGICLDLIALE